MSCSKGNGNAALWTRTLNVQLGKIYGHDTRARGGTVGKNYIGRTYKAWNNPKYETKRSHDYLDLVRKNLWTIVGILTDDYKTNRQLKLSATFVWGGRDISERILRLISDAELKQLNKKDHYGLKV